MLKRLHCQLKIVLGITPVDPILIRSSYLSPSGVHMPFVVTFRKKKEGEVYLPGSSLKGVIRSHAEKICRTLKEGSVCIPYEREGSDQSCGERFKASEKNAPQKEKISSQSAYRHSCPACRTFGSTYFIGRLSAADAYADPAPIPEIRDGVAINRYTGGAAGTAKFDYEVISHGTFQTTIILRNFEFWQTALLAFILRDFKDEFIRIGAGKSRGLGRVKGKIEQATLTYYDDTPALRDLKDFCSPGEQKAYGLAKYSVPSPAQPNLLSSPSLAGIRREYDLTGKWDTFGELVAPALSKYLAALERPGELTPCILNQDGGAQ